MGQNNTQTCSLDTVVFPSLALTSYILLGLLPAINLVFAVNNKDLKTILKQFRYNKFTAVSASRENSTWMSKK